MNIVVVVIAYTIAGVLRGFVWELAVFCTLLFGVIAGLILNYPVGMLLNLMIGNIVVARALGFFIAFVTVSLVFRVVASFAKAKIQQWKWETADRRLGGVLGFLEAVVLTMVVCTAVALYSTSWKGVHESFLGRKAVVAFCYVLPSAVRHRILTALRGATQRIEEEIDRRSAPPGESDEERTEREAAGGGAGGPVLGARGLRGGGGGGADQ